MKAGPGSVLSLARGNAVKLSQARPCFFGHDWGTSLNFDVMPCFLKDLGFGTTKFEVTVKHDVEWWFQH